MAKLLGVPAMPFDIMYPEKAIEFKRTVLDYIKVLRRAHQDISQGDVVDVVNGIERNTLKVDATGFPLAPRPRSWTKVTRAEVEPIFRLYMTRHYRK
jgi:hypothetical protein